MCEGSALFKAAEAMFAMVFGVATEQLGGID